MFCLIFLNYEQDNIEFISKSGNLIVKKDNDLISLNFPARNPQKIQLNLLLSDALKLNPKKFILIKL